MKGLLLLIPSFILLACNSQESGTHEDLLEQEDESIKMNVTPLASDSISETTVYTTEAFFTEEIGWGYKIFKDGKQYINQPHIPAISGVKGFESEEDALKTADLARYKIENGIVPPTITIEELDSLQVLN